MSEQSIAISEQRWEDLVNKVKCELDNAKVCGDVIEDEINLIVSVLKSNIPFDVVSDLSNNEVKL